MFCQKCGTSNKEEFRFCQGCGAPIENAGPSVATPGNQVLVKKIKPVTWIAIIALFVCVFGLGYFAYDKLFGKDDNVGLFPIKVDQAWGFMNRDGDLKITPQYSFVGKFSEGLAVVAKKNNTGGYTCGFVDKSGKVVIEMKYVSAGAFKEGLAAVAVGEGRNRKWGYINGTGQFVIQPQFVEAYGFSEGLAIVSAGTNKWGFIDKTGKFVIAPEFSDGAVGYFEGHTDPKTKFVNGLAPIANKDGLWGFIDKTGKFVITPQYASANIFVEDLAAVAVATNPNKRKWGFIDKTGKIIISPQFDDAGEFSEGKAVVSVSDAKSTSTDSRLFGVINKKGEFVIQPIWPNYQITQRPRSWDAHRGAFSEGMLALSKQTSSRIEQNVGTWGFIDVAGKPVIEQKFLSVSDFSNGLAAVTLEDKTMAYIDKTGKIIKPKMPSVSDSSNKTAGSLGADGYAQPGERRKVPDNEKPRTPAPSVLRKDALEAPDFYILDILNWNLGQKHQVTIKKAVEWFGTPVEKRADNNPTAKSMTLMWKDFILVIDGVSADDDNGTVVWLQWQGPATLKSYRGIGIGDSKSKVIEKYGGNYRSRESGGLEWIIFTGNEAQGISGKRIGFGVDPATQTVKSVYQGMLPVSVGMVFPK